MRRSIVFAAIGIGLALAVSTANAQPVTGTTYLSNIDPNGSYIVYQNAWTSLAYTFTSTPTGLEINGPGGTGSFGDIYYPLPPNQVTPLNPADTQLTFAYTLNSGTPVGPIQEVVALDDANGGVDYYFSGYVTPQLGLNSFTVPLVQNNLGNIQAGYPINGLSIQLDPANMQGNYDLTFNSITLSTVPEPASFGLGAIGLCFLAARRNRKAAAKA